MIGNINSKTSFAGTTIIKKEGGNVLTKEIQNSANMSRPGYINTRLDGYSMIVVADVFQREEAEYHKFLKKQNLDFIYSNKALNHKLYSLPELKDIIKAIAKTRLI